MKLNVRRVNVWAAGIEDQPGGLAKKLSALAEAGCDLEFVIARRAPDKPGKGVLFLTPVTGQRQIRAARKLGFLRTKSLHSLRVEGSDKPGAGARVTGALAEAGVNLRGLSAAVVGRKFILYVALDTAKEAARATRILKRV